MALFLILALSLASAEALGCFDESPDVELSCPELVSLDSAICQEDFMIGQNYCAKSCGRDPCPCVVLNLQPEMTVGQEGMSDQESESQLLPAGAPSALLGHADTAPLLFPASPGLASPSPPTEASGNFSAISLYEANHLMEVATSEPTVGPFPGGTPAGFQETTEPTAHDFHHDAEMNQMLIQSSECQTPASFLASRSDLSIFLRVSEKFGVINSFSSRNLLVTAFIPSNNAFLHLMDVLGLSEVDFMEGKKHVMQQLLLVHLAHGKIVMDQTVGKTIKLPTLLSTRQALEVTGKVVTSPGGPKANIVEGDIDLCRTTVHILDGVLVPAPIVVLQKSFSK